MRGGELSGFGTGMFGCGFVCGFCLMGWYIQDLSLALHRLYGFYQGWLLSRIFLLGYIWTGNCV